MKNQGYNLFIEQRSYPHLRNILSEELASLPTVQLEEAVEPMLGNMTIEEYEDFLSSLSKYGKQVGNVLTRAAPGALSGAVQGATMGSAMGPYGALIGGALGAVGGGLQSYQASGQQARTNQSPAGQQPTVRQTVVRPSVQPAVTNLNQATFAPASGGLNRNPVSQPLPGAVLPGSAAAQLLAVLSRPETLQAILSMMMSQAGRSNVQVGQTQVPVAAFSNMISTLAQRSSAQQNQIVASQAQSTPEYLQDENGEFICDPMDAEQRADVLLGLLSQQPDRLDRDNTYKHKQPLSEVLYEEQADSYDNEYDRFNDDADADEEWEEELDELFG